MEHGMTARKKLENFGPEWAREKGKNKLRKRRRRRPRPKRAKKARSTGGKGGEIQGRSWGKDREETSTSAKRDFYFVKCIGREGKKRLRTGTGGMEELFTKIFLLIGQNVLVDCSMKGGG